METRTLPGTVSVGAADWPMHETMELSLARLLERHLFHGQRRLAGERPLQLQVRDPGDFGVHLRSSMLGDMPYCCLAADPHVCTVENPRPTARPLNMLLLQQSGVSSFRFDDQELRVRPGEMLLVPEPKRLRVEHETRVEQIVLMNPLPPAEVQRLTGGGLQRWTGSDGQERMLFRWVRDACTDSCWDASDAAYEVSGMLARLLGRVLGRVQDDLQRPHAPPAPEGVTRHGIEDFIAQRLEQADLTLGQIAEAFGCSVRTLHRAFARGGDESLERHLWRRRAEACAQALRGSGARSTTLTDLALRYGFKSPAHFSGLFRDMLGVSPSEYRRQHLAR